MYDIRLARDKKLTGSELNLLHGTITKNNEKYLKTKTNDSQTSVKAFVKECTFAPLMCLSRKAIAVHKTVVFRVCFTSVSGPTALVRIRR